MNSTEAKINMKTEKKDEKNNAAEERRFVQLSPETIQLISESVEIPAIHSSISRALSEDASYRCREIVHLCGQLLRHGKRRRLNPEDLNRALRWYDADPIYGHGSSTESIFHRIPDADIFVPDDEKLVNLTNYALSNTVYQYSDDPVVQASWLSLEGTHLPEGEEMKPIECPQQNNLTPALIQYYSTVTVIILGDSQEMLEIILADLKTNPKIGTLLPYFVSFIRNALQKHCDNHVITCRLLYLLQSLFSNNYLNLSPKPYLSHLVTGLLSSLIIERRGRELSESEKLTLNVDHVALASQILRQVLDRWATPVNLLRSQTLRALKEYLKDAKISYSSQYGALSAMIALGPKVLENCLLPQMDYYLLCLTERLQKLEETGNRRAVISSQTERKVIIQMLGMILKAARVILEYRSKINITNPCIQTRIKKEEKEGDSDPPNSAAATTSSFLGVYESLYAYFGDALSVVSLPCIKRNHVHFQQPETNKRYKFRIRKYEKNYNPDVIYRSNILRQSLTSDIKRKDSKLDGVFSSSQNFTYLADMGVPSDIFDDPTVNDSLMPLSSIIQNGIPVSDSRTMLSESVREAFEMESSFTITRYPKIRFSFGPPQWDKLKRRDIPVDSSPTDQKIKRNCFIGRKLGINNRVSERQKIQRLFSCSLKTNL